MIQVDEVLNDPDLCVSFVIIRQTGQPGAGGWQTNAPQNIQAYGAVRNTTGKELNMVPEADQVEEMLTFRSVIQMFVTNAAGSMTSDILVYQGDNYRVHVVKNYSDQGYYLAIAARTAGN